MTALRPPPCLFAVKPMIAPKTALGPVTCTSRWRARHGEARLLARGALDARGLELRLGRSTGRIQTQVAFLEELHLPEVGASFIELPARRLEPRLEVCGRCGQIVAPLDRRLGEGRIGVVVDVGYAGPLLLDRDLAVEVASHMVEVADHGLDLGNLPALLLDLKALQADHCVACLHYSLPPTLLGHTDIHAGDAKAQAEQPGFQQSARTTPRQKEPGETVLPKSMIGLGNPPRTIPPD